jgi:hypothetical protein
MANSPFPVHPDLEESICTQTKIDSAPNLHPHVDHLGLHVAFDARRPKPHAVPPRQTNLDSPLVPQGQTSRPSLLSPRRLSLVCLILTPLIAFPIITRVLADHLAPAMAQVVTTNLARLFAWREIAEPEENTEEFAEPKSPGFPQEAFVEPNETAPSSAQTAKKKHRGILVRTDAVVRAVQSGGRPSSSPAPASGTRPAGLSLVGVSHFGTGLRDGDILTSVGGTPATSEGAVIALVAGAISQGAKVITGVVWRDNQRLDVAVEIPGPEAFQKKRRRPSVHQ